MLMNLIFREVFVHRSGVRLNYVVPENIQTPTTEGIGNSRGVGGLETQEIPEGGGGWTIKSLSGGAISFRFRPEFEHCFLPTLQIIFRT